MERSVFLMAMALTAEKRESSKKSVTRNLRRNGKIPAVLYGKTVTNQLIAVDEREMIRVFQENGRNGVVQMQLDGTTISVIAHEIQYDPLKRKWLHLDFLEVDMDHEMDVDVPILFMGEDVVTKAGGVIQHQLNELKVRALPKDIPGAIEVDVSDLKVGDVLKVKDIKAKSGYTLLNEDDDVIVSVIPPARDRGQEDLDVKAEIEENKEDHAESEE
jgi:large subunit ribosomal protein L25